MLVYSSFFSNHLEFAELFGTPKERVNKITLAAMKSKLFFDLAKEAYLDGIRPRRLSSRVVFSTVMEMLNSYISGEMYTVKIIKYKMKVPNDWQFPTMGVSTDENPSVVYYKEWVSTKNGFELKNREVKPGKFIKSIIEKCNLILTDEVINFISEEFSNQWKAFVNERKQLTLNVSSDEFNFEAAYNNMYYAQGSFDSCMENRGYHTFYTDAVNASVAILENEDEEILARCVIFNEVMDDDSGEIFRLAERQYSYNDIYKRILIGKLIQEKRIDGYKVFGAGCGDKTAFVSIDGEDLSNRNFSIECHLELGDPLSYQDSFYGYDYYAKRAYNYKSEDFDLDTTDGQIGNWDDYHKRFVMNTVTVYVDGYEFDCDEDDLEDFVISFGNQYHHIDDVVWSDYHDCYIVEANAIELHDGTWALLSRAYELYDGRWATEDEIVELHNGKWALCSESVFNNEDGNWYLKEA